MQELDLDSIRHAIRTAQQLGVDTVDLVLGDTSFNAVLDPTFEYESAPMLALVDEQDCDDVELPGLVNIESTAVGYFNDQGKKLALGARVAEGDIVGQIRALGLNNDLRSKFSGEIVEVLVQEGAAVEFGQIIAVVKPS